MVFSCTTEIPINVNPFSLSGYIVRKPGERVETYGDPLSEPLRCVASQRVKREGESGGVVNPPLFPGEGDRGGELRKNK